MNVVYMDLRQDAGGRAKVTLVLDAKPGDLSETCHNIKTGKPYTVEIKPYRKQKSKDQNSAIWAKICELANAVRSTKDEVYDECLRRYGDGTWMRILKKDLPIVESIYKAVDVKKEHEDGSVTVLAYKGLSQMNTEEASRLLDGVLDECREVGISAEVRL